ncbi:MAG: AAA domain-containing protein [Limnochordia bacterium]|jgi:very-short-patch-repair endonuclease
MDMYDPSSNEEKVSQHKQKAIRLVDYLAQLALLRSKVVHNIAEYERVLWLSRVPHERGCFTQAWGRDEEHESDVWVEVQNRREPELPAVPAQCKDWVNRSSLRNKNDLPELLPKITRQVDNPDWHEGSVQPDTTSFIDRLRDHPEVRQAWDQYVEHEWLPWVEDHNAWERVDAVYSSLFAIYQAQLRLGEEYELVLGLGLLTWQTPTGQRVSRHLIVADVVLEFEARLGRFTIRPHTEGARLRPELDMLHIEERPARVEEVAKTSLAEAEDDPWDRGAVDGVLQALVHSLDARGVYSESLERKGNHPSLKPIVEFAPAVVLRKRSERGLTEALKRIREQIENGGRIPNGFADLAEIHSQDPLETNAESHEPNLAFGGEIFFPKPSNEEQRRIVDQIQSSNGVLVQGPPGTGKSHTIANLVCHLLATGHRTLITAKTPRALKVLERLVPEELRPLCINLLGSGPEERRSLESSVDGILRKRDDWDEELVKRTRQQLEDGLQKLREEKARINRRLRDIRESETYTHSVAEGTYRGTAARITEAVNRDRTAYGWFTDSVPLDKPCPESISNLSDILSDLRHFTPEKRRQLELAWPDVLLSTEEFADLVNDENHAIKEEEIAVSGAEKRVADLLVRHEASTIEAVCDALSRLGDARTKLIAAPHAWMNNAVQDILGGNSSVWHEVFRVTQEVILLVRPLVAIADETRIDLPEDLDVRTLYEDACRLKEHLENGGKLGWGVFRPKVVKERLHLIKSVRVQGELCSTIERLSSLTDALRVRLEFDKVWSYWDGRTARAQGPYALQFASLEATCSALQDALALEGLVQRCREVLKECPGSSEPVWNDESRVDTVFSSCQLALARIRKQSIRERIHFVETPVSDLTTKPEVHPVTFDLLRAIRDRDIDGFSQCVSRIRDLEQQRQSLEELNERLSELRNILPNLTSDLERTYNEPCWDERIQHIRDAYRWAQARYWIDEYLSQDDAPALAKRAKQIEDETSDTIAKLAALHAWSFCFSRMKDEHHRHMHQWKWHMNKGGKFTGKHAPYHRREAQKHLDGCREVVPAWVMPLYRVWDTVSPEQGMFDVIIVDEASQCGMEALPLFYLARKILIVGDDKQISPDAVGVSRDRVHALMKEFLDDFSYRDSFDVESSLFDHAKLRYGTHRITLREHFRCMPEIIRFSNGLCYSDTPLVPLRQYVRGRLPPLEHVFVRRGYREGPNHRAVNRPEAEAIVERVVEMCSDSRYNDKSIGVVTLQGEAQAALIESLLLKSLGPEEMERRHLICGNPYSFQGDERDIILLSLVAAPNARIGPFTRESDERRFNVAASRARDQMILFHSVTCGDLSEFDLRRRLLEFFQETKPQQIAGIEQDELERRATQDNRSIIRPPVPFESWFEVDVALELLRRGFIVIPQYEVAGKRIDLVVEGSQTRLAVECDGDYWHGADQYEADMQRQRQLERCGWEFFRVRESAFYSNKVDALAGLWQALEERGIRPSLRCLGVDSEVATPKKNQDASDRVVTHNDDGIGARIEWSASLEGEPKPSRRRAEEITTEEIQKAILRVLSECPNRSCALKSLTARVLKEVDVLTRGKPWRQFENRVMQSVSILEEVGSIETYRAKNRRLRLIL